MYVCLNVSPTVVFCQPSLSTYKEGVSPQSSLDQGEAGVLQQGENSGHGHHQAIQLPKVTGWKTEREREKSHPHRYYCECVLICHAKPKKVYGYKSSG